MQARVLLVDDEPAIVLTLSSIFEMHGYKVETATSAREAAGKLEGGDDFDVIVTDMKMETETAGYDVVRAARKLHRYAIVALLTAYPSSCNEWREQGAHLLLEKPIHPDTLLQQIRVRLASVDHTAHAQRLGTAA